MLFGDKDARVATSYEGIASVYSEMGFYIAIKQHNRHKKGDKP